MIDAISLAKRARKNKGGIILRTERLQMTRQRIRFML